MRLWRDDPFSQKLNNYFLEVFCHACAMSRIFSISSLGSMSFTQGECENYKMLGIELIRNIKLLNEN